MKQLDQAIAIAAKQAKKAPQVLADTASEVAAKVRLPSMSDQSFHEVVVL
jgi:type III secretion system FlhB-like substrate exporter